MFVRGAPAAVLQHKAVVPASGGEAETRGSSGHGKPSPRERVRRPAA
jgi:hypothetical protein